MSASVPRAADARPAPSVRAGAAATWLLAIRPRTLVASAVPVLVGLALAGRSATLDVSIALATLGCALALQIAANLANDYFDWRRGIDTEHRLGPLRVMQAGLVSPSRMRVALGLVLAVATLLGLYLVASGGAPILAIGLAAIVCALAYSAGPYPLASHGFGEALVLAFFGVAAVGGTVWLQARTFDARVLVAGLTTACPAAALIVVNNLRDIGTDRTAGKRTVAVRIGARATRLEYTALVGAAFAGACALAVMVTPGALLALIASPLAAGEVSRLYERDGAALNASLAGTAKLLLVFGVLLAAGLAL